LFIQAVGVWRDLERVFAIRERGSFTFTVSSSGVTAQELELQEKEFWYGLVLAANFRKFVFQKEDLYLPTVAQALIDLGKIPAGSDAVGFIREEFEAVHSGKIQIGSYDNGQGKTLSAYEIVDNLLHGLFLHGNSKRVSNLEMFTQGLKSLAVWEWLAYYRPLLELLADAVADPSEGGGSGPEVEET